MPRKRGWAFKVKEQVGKGIGAGEQAVPDASQVHSQVHRTQTIPFLLSSSSWFVQETNKEETEINMNRYNALR